MPKRSTPLEVPTDALTTLREHLALREIKSGFDLLRSLRSHVDRLGPTMKNGAALLDLLLLWIDVGYSVPASLKRTWARFAEIPESLEDYLHFRMAQGTRSFMRGDYKRGIEHFHSLLFDREVIEKHDWKDWIAIVVYMRARFYRQIGAYKEAMDDTDNAMQLAQAKGREKMAAVMSIMKAWLLGQSGKKLEAMTMLEEALEVIKQTDDHKAFGDIKSAQARILRRFGRREYGRVSDLLEESIRAYSKLDSKPHNQVRALANLAFTNLLQAEAKEKDISEDDKRVRSVQELLDKTAHQDFDALIAQCEEADPTFNLNRQYSHSELLETFVRDLRAVLAQHTESRKEKGDEVKTLRIKARTALEQAGDSQDNSRDRGTVQLHWGHLYLQEGSIHDAEKFAGKAFESGGDTDSVLMARARILQSKVAMRKAERLPANAQDPDNCRSKSLDFANEAVNHAKDTEIPRLRAAAYIQQGLAILSNPDREPDQATKCYDRATELLRQGSVDCAPSDVEDYLWGDLALLNTKLPRLGAFTEKMSELLNLAKGGGTEMQTLKKKFEDSVICEVLISNENRPKDVRKLLRCSEEPVNDHACDCPRHPQKRRGARKGVRSARASLGSNLRPGRRAIGRKATQRKRRTKATQRKPRTEDHQ